MQKCRSKCKVAPFTTDTSRKFSQAPTQLHPLLAALIKSRPKVQAGQRLDLPENKCLVYSTCSVSVRCLAKANSKGVHGKRRKAISGTERVHRGAWKPNPTWLPFSLAACFQCIPLGGKYTNSNSLCPPICKGFLTVSKHTNFHLKQSHRTATFPDNNKEERQDLAAMTDLQQLS